MRNYDYGYNNYQAQAQLQGSRQQIKQAQDQEYSNSTLGNLLATAESLACISGYKKPRKYAYYDPYDTGCKKSKDELRTEFMYELECFNISYKNYIKTYKYYDYPRNNSLNSIINDINEWKMNVKEKDQHYYDSLIKILNNEEFESYEEKILENCKNKDEKEDLKNSLCEMANAKHYADKKGKNVKEQIEKTGKYSNEMVIGGQPGNLNKRKEKNNPNDNLENKKSKSKSKKHKNDEMDIDHSLNK